MVKKIVIITLCFLGIRVGIQGQNAGLKSNLFYLFTTTPNAGLEFKTGDHFTLSFSGSYNPFDFPSRENHEGRNINPKLKHWIAIPEIKYWFCKSFEGSYIGLHGIYGVYNLGGIRFIKDFADYRYNGWATGGGMSYGYQWALGNRWGVEFSLGAGYLFLNYKKYDCAECGDYVGDYKRNYFGPTKLVFSLIYYLN